MTSLASTLPAPVLAHLQLPLALQGDGSFSFWQQDTLDDVGQCVEVLCGTQAGQRTVVPTYGLPDQAFTQPNQQVILNAINLWEPRANVVVNVTYPDDSEAQVSVRVNLNQNIQT